MSLENNSEDPLIGAAGFVFQTPVRAKRSKKPKQPSSKALRRLLKRQAAAVVSKRPEVMVKVSGSAKGRKHLGEHLAYISRNGKLVAETSEGELVLGREDVAQVAAEWWAQRSEKLENNARERDTYNLVLSMPEGTDPDKLRDAVREFAKREFGGKHDYVFVLHTKDNDPSKKTKQPHVHLTVRTLGLQGQYLNPRKDDLQAWREGFAAALRRRGVLAEATPRRARGVVQKGTRQALRHMGKRARVNQWKVDQALKSLQGGATPREEPWRASIQQRQTKIREAWRTIAKALDAQGETALALQVGAFVDAMPSLRTRQDALQLQAAQAVRAPEQAGLLKRAQTALQPDPTQDQGKKRR